MRKMLAGTALALMLGGTAFAQATDPAADATAADPMEEMVTISVDGTETEVPMEQASLACPDADFAMTAPGEPACEITQAEADEAGIVVDDTLATDAVEADDDLAADGEPVEGEEETQ